jgi:hypothetical protein
MGRTIDISLISIYLVFGLASYSLGLLTIAGILSRIEARGMAECGEQVLYGVMGVLAVLGGVYLIIKAIMEAVEEAIREARRD